MLALPLLDVAGAGEPEGVVPLEPASLLRKKEEE